VPDFISPEEVRFSQESIKGLFKAGGTIEEMAEGLKNGTVAPAGVAPIRLVEKEGQWFTLDNRRLEAFRRAGVLVPYRIATLEETAEEQWKFTTHNGGTSIRVREEQCEETAMRLTDKTSFVYTREDLALFVQELAHNLRTQPQEWENVTLPEYLEAMAAWIEDADGYYSNAGKSVPQQPSWQNLAEILLAAKHYE